MAYIKIKPEIIFSDDSSYIPLTYKFAISKIGRVKWEYRNTNDVVVHHMQKIRRKVIFVNQLTKTGKVSKKKPICVVTPTHWKITCYLIPYAVVKLLEKNGQKIIQYKHHWAIE